MNELEIFKCIKKKFSSGFLNNAKFVGMNQITCKSCNKAAECRFIKFFKLAITQSNFPSTEKHKDK